MLDSPFVSKSSKACGVVRKYEPEYSQVGFIEAGSIAGTGYCVQAGPITAQCISLENFNNHNWALSYKMLRTDDVEA